MSRRILSWTLFALTLGLVMRQWFSPTLPLTVTGENVPEINYIWQLRILIEQGSPFTAWNPKALAGEAVSSHMFYPFFWLAALFSSVTNIPPETLYKASVYLFFLLGAIFMYEFVVKLTRQPAAGLVAGLIFSLTPAHMNTMEGFFLRISWMMVPIVFWLYESEFAQTQFLNIKGAVRLGLAIGVMALASLQIPLMMIFILPPYIILREWQLQKQSRQSQKQESFSDSVRQKKFWHDWLKQRGKLWLVVIGITMGIAAYYFIPLIIEYQHLAFSRFANFPSAGTITPQFLLYLLRARWFANFSPENFHEVTWYLGGATVLLALVGITSRYKTSIVIFFTIAGLLSLLLMVGDNLSPFPNIVYNTVEQLPVLKSVLRHSFRWVLPLSFSLAVLAGYGTATLVTRLNLSTGLWSYITIILLAGLITFDFSPLYASFKTTPAYLRNSEMNAIAWLNQQDPNARYFTPFANGTPRTYHLVYGHHLIKRPAVWDDQYVSHFVSKRSYFFLAGLNVQLPDLPSGLLEPLFLQMLDLGAVQHILLNTEAYNHRDLFNTATELGAPVVFEQDEVKILLNRNARPLMQLYPKTALYLGNVTKEEQIRDWLPRLAPQEVALLEASTPDEELRLKPLVDYLLFESETELATLSSSEQSKALSPEQAGELSKPTMADYQINWTRLLPSRAEVVVQLAQPATLVFAEAWYPGWRVYVDGIEQPLIRANYAFQGVTLSAGAHSVIFEFRRPVYVWIGAGISLVTLIIALTILLKPNKPK